MNRNFKTIFALSMCAVLTIGLSTIASCSADEDYSAFAGDELETLAEGDMSMSGEVSGDIVQTKTMIIDQIVKLYDDSLHNFIDTCTTRIKFQVNQLGKDFNIINTTFFNYDLIRPQISNINPRVWSGYFIINYSIKAKKEVLGDTIIVGGVETLRIPISQLSN